MGLLIKKISNHEKVKEATLRFFASSALILLGIISLRAFMLSHFEVGTYTAFIFIAMAGNLVYYHITDNFKRSVHALIITVIGTMLILYFNAYEPAFILFFFFTFPAIAIILGGNKYGSIYSILPFLLSLHPLFFPKSNYLSDLPVAIILSLVLSYLAILGVVNFNEYLRKKWHESYQKKMAEKNKYIIKIMDEHQDLTSKYKTRTAQNQGVFRLEAKLEEAENGLIQANENPLGELNKNFSPKTREALTDNKEAKAFIRQIQKENIDLQQTIDIITEQQQKINEITGGMRDGLNYARTIQDAMLPSKETMSEILNEYFILYYPKEIVSGDFYYVNKVNHYIVAAVADCTGHGVPGGFLTMLGITFLHEIVGQPEIKSTGEILNALRERIKQIFSHFGSKNSDGLDIALIAIDTKTGELQYSGAFNPLVIINKESFTEYKATRNPIGYYPVENNFKTKTIELKENDMIYMFSDGFADQPGGSDHKRFSSRNFKEVLYQIHETPVKKQSAFLENIYNNWRGSFEQIDDVCVMGIKWKSSNN
jgi:serine phosphatase RsbU (regulator of sigma subunit)